MDTQPITLCNQKIIGVVTLIQVWSFGCLGVIEKDAEVVIIGRHIPDLQSHSI